MANLTSIEQFLPVSTMGIAIATDGAVWLYHPPSPDGMVEILPPVTPTPPVNTQAPNIAVLNGLQVGQQLILQNGTWTNSPTFTRRWESGGVTIPGATTTSYTMQQGDVGNMIQGFVTGTNQDGSATAASNSVGPVIEPPLAEEPESAGPVHRRSSKPSK